MKRVALSAMAVMLTASLLSAQPPRGERPDGFRPPNPLMMIFDADADGELSKEEVANAPKALAKLDKNENGTIEEDELPRPPRPERGTFGGNRPGGNDGERPERQSTEERIKEMDKNKDGFIQKDELSERIPQQFRDRLFEGWDANKDGKVSKEEMEAARERFGQGRRPGQGGRPGGEGRPGDGEGRPRRPGGDAEEGARPRRPERPAA